MSRRCAARRRLGLASAMLLSGIGMLVKGRTVVVLGPVLSLAALR